MHQEFKPWLKELYERICNDFYLPETQLFYDYLSSHNSSGLTHLPVASEVADEFPNPCGWGTGMEDCSLHAGSMIDTLCLTGNFTMASQVLKGLFRLVTVHGNEGFVARGISPYAAATCYPNSSRDQFTLAVSGAWRMFCAAPSKTDKELACKILQMISAYCRNTVSANNSYNLLRRDGKYALVSKMWHNNPHECLRLPMIYAAAGVATNSKSTILCAENLLEEAICRTLDMDDSRNWWDIELSQLQLSIKLLLECRAFPEHEPQLQAALKNTTYLALRELEILLTKAEKFTGNWNVCMVNWRECEMRDVISSDEDGNIHYKAVCFPSEFHTVTELLRGIGNLLVTISTSQDIPNKEFSRLKNILATIDLEKCCSGGIIQLFQGLLNMLRVKNQENDNNILMMKQQ